MLKRWAAVNSEAGNAKHGELHRENIALFTRRVVTRRMMHCGHLAVRKGRGVKARRFQSVLVEPKANRVFGNRVFHRAEYLDISSLVITFVELHYLDERSVRKRTNRPRNFGFSGSLSF